MNELRSDIAEERNIVDYEEVSVPVLVIGAGAAGARAAISLAERGIEPLVIGKRDHGDAHTTWAAGGINAALGNLDPEDSWEIHAADTYKEGHFLNDPTAVELVAESMPDRIAELDDWGMGFNRTEEGEIDQRYFGAQSYRRTCFVGDRTGEAILETLIGRAQDLDVPYRENVMITKLLSDGKQVHGAAGYDMASGEFVVFSAEHVVLAAGGHAALYDRHSSRDDENTGDGAALALDAGGSLVDMEFVQFHPTGMVGERYGEEWDGRLVTEAVRGEGGTLRNAEGERFMEHYSPEQMELDARDVVARAIANEISEGRGTEHDGVYLDISHEDREFIEERLPSMYERFAELGVDLAEEPVEVAPTAHYAMGGVDIDFDTGNTGIDGLYAVGETTGGVHGANRLGGNSLAETVAVGKILGESIPSIDGKSRLPDGMNAIAMRHFGDLARLAESDGDTAPEELIEELRSTMETHAGVLRDAETLDAGLDAIREIRKRTANLGIEGDRTGRSFEFAIDLQFSLRVAETVLESARKRTESRGAHHRTDHEETNNDWQTNILVEPTDTGTRLVTRRVGDPSHSAQKAIDEDHELDYHHLE
jgi:succinate dehydrogenase / fumarate reductase flavoprotein subunit